MSPLILFSFVLLTSAAPPVIEFHPPSQRLLIFSNEPEQIRPDALTDNGKLIFVAPDIRGKVRAWYEHLTLIGKDTLSFGLIVHNPATNPDAVRIHVTGRGSTSSWDGSLPFHQLFTEKYERDILLKPGQWEYLIRQDSLYGNWTCCTGVADFEVMSVTKFPPPPVNVVYAAFQRPDTVDPTLPMLPYFDPTAPETDMLCYKGIAASAEMEARDIDFLIDDSTPAGPLPVRFRPYDLNKGTYLDLVTRTNFTTHIGPASTSEAVTSDNVDLYTPGWGWISVFSATDGLGNFPNWGNWAVMYLMRGKVTNHSSRDRRFTFTYIPPGGAPVCFQRSDASWGHAWPQGPTEPTVIYDVFVPRGATLPYSVNWVLGGPAYGAEVSFFATS